MKLRVDKHWLDTHINTQVYHLQVVQEQREASSHDGYKSFSEHEKVKYEMLLFFFSNDNCACARQRRLKGLICRV